MKNKRDQYIKYSKKELETYVKDPKSCVKKIKTVERLTIQPWMLHDLQNSIINILGKKIGRYDSKLNGVVLDFRDTKLLNDKSTVHHDNPEFHMNIETNFYVFIPFKGAIVNGLIKHISVTEIESNVVVVIYRVFSVNILFKDKIPKELHINKEIQIRVKDFHFDNVIPYIEGELIPQTLLLSPSKNKKIHFDLDNVDSGISAEENNCTSSTSSDKKKSKPASSDDDSEHENPGPSKSPVKIKQEKQEVKVKQEKMSSSASEAESTHEDQNFTLKELKQEKKVSSDSEPEVRKRKFQSDSKLIKSPAKKRKTQSICSQESAKKADDSDISDFLASIKSLMSESESDKKKRKKKKHREAPEVKTERNSDASSEVNPKTSDAEKKKHKKSKKDKKKEDDFTASVLDLFNDSKKSAKNSSSVVTEIFTQNSFKSSESEDNTKLFQPSPTKEKKKKSEKTAVEAKTSAVQEKVKKQDIVPDSSHQEKKKKKKHKSKDNDFSASIMGLFDQHKSTTDETPAKNKDKKKKDKEATTVKPDSMDSDASLNKQKKKKKKDKKDDFMSSIDALFSKTQKN